MILVEISRIKKMFSSDNIIVLEYLEKPRYPDVYLVVKKPATASTTKYYETFNTENIQENLKELINKLSWLAK